MPVSIVVRRDAATALLRSIGALLFGVLAVALVALAPLAARAQAWEAGTDGLAPIPALSARVTDLTGTLSAQERSALETRLAQWEQKSGNQLVVLIVPSTQPEPIEAYSLRVAEAWKIGRKGRDNGVVFLVAKNDRKMRFEVGYGLEGAVPDAVARRIIAETVAPQFRQGQFGPGIAAGVDQLIGIVDRTEPAAPVDRPAQRPGKPGFSFEMLFILLFVVIPLLGTVLRSMFGKVIGSTVGAGIVGVGAFVVAGSLLIAVGAAVISWIVMLFLGAGMAAGGLPRGRGGWGGGWGGGLGGGGFGGGGGLGGGGGGFSGGGGGFGGGGASGNW